MTNSKGWQVNRSFALLAMLGLGSALSSPSASAATFVVDSVLDQQDAIPGDGVCKAAIEACTLRAAITEANALPGPDIITLPAGTYTTTLVAVDENDNLGGDFDINSDITINGASGSTTIVQAATTTGAATERVFHLRFVAPGTTATLNRLTVRHGRYTSAGDTFGAGVRVDGGAVIATLYQVVIADNVTNTGGGGLAVSGAAGSITTLDDCKVVNNIASGTTAGSSRGGGIMLNTSSATLLMKDLLISGNSASSDSAAVVPTAGGVWSSGTLNITNSTISNNVSTSSGSNAEVGGIYVTTGSATILSSTISGNTSTVTSGTGIGSIGGISNQEATLSLADSLVAGNMASHFYAGIRTTAASVPATTTINNSTISDNTALNLGGGVGNRSVFSALATTNINGSTLAGNVLTFGSALGGGLINESSSNGFALVNITNSTISGNMSARAAGTYNTGNNATINFNYATIADNAALGDGGGIVQGVFGGTVNLKNSIVADNVAATGADISGTITSQGYNHIENVSGGTFIALGGDVVGTDPQIGALADNGGITLTHLPAPTSLVVNTIPNGTSDCGLAVTTTQSGGVRPLQGACEKGSLEVSEEVLFRSGFDSAGIAGAQTVFEPHGGRM